MWSKLFRWGKRATLLIQNGILSAINGRKGPRSAPDWEQSDAISSRKHTGRPGTARARWSPESALEYERGQPLQTGQNRRSRVEQRPVAEIAMGTGHDGRPWRLRRGENADQPAAIPQLGVQALGDDLGCAVEDDDVERCRRGIALGGSCRLHRDISTADLR